MLTKEQLWNVSHLILPSSRSIRGYSVEPCSLFCRRSVSFPRLRSRRKHQQQQNCPTVFHRRQMLGLSNLHPWRRFQQMSQETDRKDVRRFHWRNAMRLAAKIIIFYDNIEWYNGVNFINIYARVFRTKFWRQSQNVTRIQKIFPREVLKHRFLQFLSIRLKNPERKNYPCPNTINFRKSYLDRRG